MVAKGVLFRFGVLLVAASAIVCTAAKLACPTLGFMAIAKALLIFAMFLAAYSTLWYFAWRFPFPNRVQVYEDGVVRYSKFVIRPADIQSSKLIVYSTQHTLLVIREKGSLHKIAVAPSVDRHLLVSLLGAIKIVDAQRHSPLAWRKPTAAKGSA